MFSFLLKTIIRLIIIISATIGLYVQLVPNGLFKLSYYTLLSNAVILFLFLYLIVKQIKYKNTTLSPALTRIKGGATLCIALTFLVYAILLAPKAKPEDFYHIKNYTLHYIVPIACIIDWFLFDEKGHYHKFDPFYWSIFPLLYCVVSLIKGYVFRIPIPDEPHSPYPYFFLNIDAYGWNSFFIYFVSLLFLYIVLGYVALWIKQAKSR